MGQLKKCPTLPDFLCPTLARYAVKLGHTVLIHLQPASHLFPTWKSCCIMHATHVKHKQQKTHQSNTKFTVALPKFLNKRNANRNIRRHNSTH